MLPATENEDRRFWPTCREESNARKFRSCVDFFSSWNIMAKAKLEYSLIFYGMNFGP